MTDDTFRRLQTEIRAFAVERDWEPFHLPKNLVLALMAEAGELAEPFQWLTAEEAGDIMGSARAADVEDELADVTIYLLRLADVLGVDLREVVERKLERNRSRFPADKVRGRADLPPEVP